MPISMFLKANVQRLGSYQKLYRLNSLRIPSGVASLSTPRGYMSTTHRGDAQCTNSLNVRVVMEVGHTSGVWLDSKLILRKLPRVSEVATNHWVFSKLWLVTWLYLVLLPILGYEKWFLSLDVWLRMRKVLSTLKRLSIDSPLFW